MKIGVLGAGLAGVATAYHLLRDGHTVTVFDRSDAVADGTSHANAGLICVSETESWARPGAPLGILRDRLKGQSTIRVTAPRSLHHLRWYFEFLRNCTQARFERNSAAKARLCRYSREQLHAVRDATGITYPGWAEGVYHLYPTSESFDEAQVRRADAIAAGEMEVLDRRQLLDREPALEPGAERIAGALFSRIDESGDARAFTQALARWLEGQGVRFRLGTPVRGLGIRSGQVASILTDREPMPVDGAVVALGTGSVGLLRPLGVRLPILPVKGYSMTVPLNDPDRAPSLGGIDRKRHLAWLRMGDRLRVTSFAEVGRTTLSLRDGAFDFLRHALVDLFGPQIGDFRAAVRWAGLRPMTPGGPPILGQISADNLWINAGHGNMGWTMACGSGRIIADIVAGRQPEIDLDGLAVGERA